MGERASAGVVVAGDGHGGGRRRRRRFAPLVVGAMLAAGSLGTGSPSASADGALNASPDTAVVVSALPYTSPHFDYFGGETGVETDPVSAMVADECNAGAPIFAARWWKVAPAATSTFVAHLARTASIPVLYEPIGTAVVSADLSTVVTCGAGAAPNRYTKAGPLAADASEPVYLVTYQDADPGETFFGPAVAVIPSSGSPPANDTFSGAMPIGSLPFSGTQDTTLATNDPDEGGCSLPKFGIGPGVWYAWTATQAGVIDVTATADYVINSIVVVPVRDGVTQERICGDQFDAEVGVRYVIGVFGYGDELVNVGRLSVTVAVAPPPPSVEVRVAASGTVDKRTGAVQVAGHATCIGTGAASSSAVTGTLRQVHRRVIHHAQFTAPSVACTGQPIPWTATVQSPTFLFTNGTASVTATVSACNRQGCTSATAQQDVRLKQR